MDPYPCNEYRCKLLRVVDGDTLAIQVDLGLRVERRLYVRITGINAPEVRGPEREEGRAASVVAGEILEKFAARGGVTLVRFEKGKSFDRWLGKIRAVDSDGVSWDFGDEMVKAGHATVVE
jgi:micrococcal nuclease